MSESKHTKGPWVMAPQGDAVYAAKGGDIVCLSPAHEGWEDSARRWPANAHLIAAAPDMLEALTLVADYLMGDDDVPENIADAINAALKKARGKQ